MTMNKILKIYFTTIFVEWYGIGLGWRIKTEVSSNSHALKESKDIE